MTGKDEQNKYLESPSRNPMFYDGGADIALKDYINIIKSLLNEAEDSDESDKSLAAAQILLAIDEPDVFYIDMKSLSHFYGYHPHISEFRSNVTRALDHYFRLKLKDNDTKKFLGKDYERLQALKDKYGKRLIQANS